MNWEKSIKNIAWALLYVAICVLTIVNNFLDIIPQLRGREVFVVLFLLGTIIVQFTYYLHHIKVVGDNQSQTKNWMKRVDKKVAFLNSKVQRIKRVDIMTEAETTNFFKEFEGGEYHAYNAPLQYEKHNRDRIEVHIERYLKKKFQGMHYYYPIFAHHDKGMVAEWMRGVQEFYQSIFDTRRLSPKQMNIVTFHVPNDTYRFLPDCNISYFFADKAKSSKSEQAIVYLHGHAFMDMKRRKPKRVLIIYDHDIIEDIKDHIEYTTQDHMRKIAGIQNFLDYLNKELLHF